MHYVLPEKCSFVRNILRKVPLGKRTKLENLCKPKSIHWLDFRRLGRAQRYPVAMPNGIDNAECSIDWGLIKVDKDRLGNNTVGCTYFPTMTNSRCALDGTLGDLNLGPFMDGKYLNCPKGPLRLGLLVFKCGRSTGYIQGELCELKTVHLTHTVVNGELILRATLEHTVVKQGDGQSAEGDSGALVIDANARVVGLHWAD